MATDDFLRARLDQMIDMRHRMAVLSLSKRMPSHQIEVQLFAHRKRAGRAVVDADPGCPSG